MGNLKSSINKYLTLELLRNKLANENKLKGLESTYKHGKKIILNPNINSFWNKKICLSNIIPDNVTKERISAVYRFIPIKTKTLLDIGIGYGYLEYLLEEKNRKILVTGIDISDKAINNLKRRFNFKLIVAKAECFPKNIGKFDLVVAMEILEHILPTETFKVLNNIKKVLNDKGTLILSVPLLINDPKIGMTFPYDSSNHVRLYSKALISSELEIAGFMICEEKEIFAFPNYRIIKKILNLMLKRWKPNILVIKASKK